MANKNLFQSIVGKMLPKTDALPEIVRQYEAFKTGESPEVPRVPFQMLTALPLSTKE